ncbi:MAG: sulfite exporter TauE/SafE family protein [Chloroflexi bacterium]|nr:sulfite exporter TauE/SafE family protein [Chloroflexota bacterium]
MYHLTLFYIIVLPILGLALSSVGTLVGLGGGFVLVPVLLVLFPEAAPTTISSISLTVVFLNATSATLGNIRARRIDMRTAALLAIGAIPAAALGAVAATHVSRDRFEVFFGVMLIVGALYILWRSRKAIVLQAVGHSPNRQIQERKGPTHRFYVNTLVAGVISPIGGFLSSFFGIGGGVIHVPAMTFILKMPPRVVSATALFVLVPTSLTGVLTRVMSGEFHEGWRRAGLLGLGALIGAQVGIYLSAKVNQRVVMLILAAAMTMVGLRQILSGM